MVDDPVRPSTGVTVSVRLEPEPPNVMFATGTKVTFEFVALSSNDPGAVCASLTENAIPLSAVLCAVVWSVILLIIGAVFATETTNIETVELTACCPAES